MAITYARAQAAVASDDNIDPAMSSFGSAVAEGNLLVVTAIERSGGSAASFVISDNGSNAGWTKRVSETTEQADNNARRTHVVWERVATATDAAQSPFTVSVDDGTANGKMCLADEFTAGATVTWAFEDVVAANTGTGSTSPLASGSTASVSGTLLLVGSAVWRLGTGGQTNIAFSGLSGVASGVGANNGRSVASAWAQDATTGTKSTSVSWDGTGHEGNVALLVFSATEEGGGGTPYGRVTETETARAFVASKAAAFGRAVETALARAFGLIRAYTTGRAAETETVRGFTAAKSAAVGRVTETETVRVFGVDLGAAIGHVAETETVRSFTVAKAADFSRAAEVETARAFSVTFGQTYGRIVETEQVRGFTAAKTVTFGRVTETETVRGFTTGPVPESIVTATGTHSLTVAASGTYTPTVAASGTHDLIAEAEGAL